MAQNSLESTHNPLPVLPSHQAYVCPGEDHPIPRSIHLARLAAYFPKCRECEHRHDTGQLPRSTVGRLEQTASRVVHPSPFRTEGVRGEYLNHLNRQIAGRLAAALADRLWETQPLIGRLPLEDDHADERSASPARTGPVVVLGHDTRPSSPDLCVGVSVTLLRMGCEVIDVGRVTGPCHAFAVEHLQADAGLYVTGSSCAPQWTGLDIVGPRGLPWSLREESPVPSRPSDSSFRTTPADDSARTSPSADRSSEPGTLNDIERRFLSGVSRPTRQGGTQRYFDAAVPYRASLLKHFRDLRPLRIVAATADPVLLETLRCLFEPLPCDLIPIADPAAEINPGSPSDRLQKQMRQIVKDADAACGVAIAEDGRGLCFYDERGRVVPWGLVAVQLAQQIRDHRSSKIVASEDCGDLDSPPGMAIQCVRGGREALAKRLFEPLLGLGLELGGRLWIRDAVPTCDAVLTISLLLRMLNTSKNAFSTLISTA